MLLIISEGQEDGSCEGSISCEVYFCFGGTIVVEGNRVIIICYEKTGKDKMEERASGDAIYGNTVSFRHI